MSLALRLSRLVRLAAALGILLSAHAAAAQERRIETASGETISAEEVDRFLRRQMNALGVPALSIAIINEGRVAYHRALGVARADSAAGVVDERAVFEAASLSKPVFAYFVMKMVEKGVLDVDTPLYEYASFDSLQNGWYAALASDERAKGITARMALSHTTGLPNWRWDRPDEQLALASAPGARFSYSGEGYELLADVIASLQGTDLEGLGRLVREEVFAPLEMRHASFVYDSTLARRKVRGHAEGEPLDAAWCCDGRAFLASGNLHTEALSYARFLITLINGEGLSEAHANAMLSAQVRLPEGHPRRAEDGITAWGLGLGIEPTAYGTRYRHGGTNSGFRSGFAFYKGKQMGHVLFTNADAGSTLNERLERFLTDGTWEPPASE